MIEFAFVTRFVAVKLGQSADMGSADSRNRRGRAEWQAGYLNAGHESPLRFNPARKTCARVGRPLVPRYTHQMNFYCIKFAK